MRVIELKTLGVDPNKLRKQIEKKEITIEEANEIGAKELYLDYKETMANALNSPMGDQRDMNTSDMRVALQVVGKIEDSKDKVYLEDSEYKFLNDRIQALRWKLAHKHIIQFVDDVAGAPEVKVDESTDKITALKSKN